MIRHAPWLVVAGVLLARGALGQPQLDESRPALLYDTYCRACHTEQVHWRDRRLVKDWTTLVAQVRRWQANLGLQWSDHEILEVAHYLNLRFYRFAPSAPAEPRLIVRAG
jgi:hypothetical protein